MATRVPAPNPTCRTTKPRRDLREVIVLDAETLEVLDWTQLPRAVSDPGDPEYRAES